MSLVVAPLILVSLTCVIIAVCLSLTEGVLPSHLGDLHPYFGLVAVGAYLGHLIQDRLLRDSATNAEQQSAEDGRDGKDVGEHAAAAVDDEASKTSSEDDDEDGEGVAQEEEGEEKPAAKPKTVAKAVVKKVSMTPSSAVVIESGPVRTKASQPTAAAAAPPADGNRLLNKYVGRCPLILNYGTVTHLSLGASEGSATPGRAGVPSTGLPGGAVQWGMRAAGEEGAAGGGLFGGSATMAGGAAQALGTEGGKRAGGVGKGAAAASGGGGKPSSSSSSSSRRRVSDFDRVLSHHASSCKSRHMAGQDLVTAIRKEQSGDRSTASTATGMDEEEDTNEGEDGAARDCAWIDQLERKTKEVVTSSRRLEPGFFRRQRGGSITALQPATTVLPAPSPTSAGGGQRVKQDASLKAVREMEGKQVGEEGVLATQGEEEVVVLAGREEEGEAASREEAEGDRGATEGKALEGAVVKEGMDEKKVGEVEAMAAPMQAGAVEGSRKVVKKGAGRRGGADKPTAGEASEGSEGEGEAPARARRLKRAEEGGKGKKGPAAPGGGGAVLARRKKMAIAEEAEGEDEEVEGEEDGGVLVYRSDLEYLQDQFRALSLVLRKNEVLVLTRERLLLGKSEAEGGAGGLDGGGGSTYAPPHSLVVAAQLGRRTKGGYGRGGGGAAGGDDGGLGADGTALCRKKVEEAEEELTEMNEKIRARLVATFEERDWIPRLEILAKTLHLRAFEKHVLVLLVREYLMSRYLGSATSGLADQSEKVGFYRSVSPRCSTSRRFDIKTLCAYFSVTFTEQLQAANQYFSKESPLVRNGIITFTPGRSYDDLYLLSGSSATHVLDATVRADEKLCDFLLGLDDTPASQVPVKGSLTVYEPSVSLDEVILPQQTRAMVVEALDGLRGYWELQHQAEAQSKLRRDRGATVFLLAGLHGTGKSTLADAIATALGKRVLLVDEAADLANTSLQAKIHDAIVVVEDMKGLKDDDGAASCLFSLMSSGRNAKSKVKDAIKELDTTQNLFIFQTESLDSVPSSIARRLALVVELQNPDLSLRRQIWDAVRPPHVELSDDVDLDELAMKWVLPGGRIKEAWTMAQVSAILRSGHDSKVMQSDLMKAAQRQLHGKLQLANLADKTTPLRGLDQAVLPPSVKKDLQTMIDYNKISGVLFGQWGFDVHHGTTKGMSALFYGPPGTGKTLAAEILAYELGKPIKKVNLAETVSMWVGETEKNLEALLKEAKEGDVVLFLDEAESMLRRRTESSASYETRWSNLLLQRIETYEGVLVAATNLQEVVDEAYQRRFKFWVEFTKPGSEDRAGIWRTLIPPQAPLASDVDFKLLGQRYELTGGEIKSAVFRAAMRAASRGQGDRQGQEIAMKDLQEAAEEEEKKKNDGFKYPHMYS